VQRPAALVQAARHLRSMQEVASGTAILSPLSLTDETPAASVESSTAALGHLRRLHHQRHRTRRHLHRYLLLAILMR
jgi:hypothetical protein